MSSQIYPHVGNHWAYWKPKWNGAIISVVHHTCASPAMTVIHTASVRYSSQSFKGAKSTFFPRSSIICNISTLKMVKNTASRAAVLMFYLHSVMSESESVLTILHPGRRVSRIPQHSRYEVKWCIPQQQASLCVKFGFWIWKLSND